MIVSPFMATPPRYFLRRFLRRCVRYFINSLPDVALIAGCTVAFVALWCKFFIK